MSTQIRGQQIRLATLTRGHVDAAFEANLAAIESNIASIFNTMSTDQERLDAIEAITLAWQNADSDLQAAITSLVNATKTGAGLEADGSYVVGTSNYLAGSPSLAQAIKALDGALKTAADAAAAAVSAETQARQDAIAGEVTARDAAIAVAVSDSVTRDTALGARIDTMDAAHVAAMDQIAQDLANETTARTNEINVLQTALADEATARATAVSDEAAQRAAAIVDVRNDLTAEALARTQKDAEHTAAIAQEVTDRGLADAAEQAAREAGDAALDARLDAVEAMVGGEAMTFARYINRETPVGAVDGVNTAFQLAFAPVLGTENVFLNGMLMEPGAGNDYTIDTLGAITLTGAPFVGDRVKVTYFR